MLFIKISSYEYGLSHERYLEIEKYQLGLYRELKEVDTRL